MSVSDISGDILFMTITKSEVGLFRASRKVALPNFSFSRRLRLCSSAGKRSGMKWGRPVSGLNSGSGHVGLLRGCVLGSISQRIRGRGLCMGCASTNQIRLTERSQME